MLEKSDLQQIKEVVEVVVEQKLKPIHKKLNGLQKDIDLIARSTDKDLTRTMHRVTRIEKHLELPPINFL